ncbi:MAG: hypothetical protein LBT36_04930 [Oscillospiraceae bacterium]|nr:hypothetical protein [Oscillospiraceae bacterium]
MELERVRRRVFVLSPRSLMCPRHLCAKKAQATAVAQRCGASGYTKFSFTSFAYLCYNVEKVSKEAQLRETEKN